MQFSDQQLVSTIRLITEQYLDVVMTLYEANSKAIKFSSNFAFMQGQILKEKVLACIGLEKQKKPQKNSPAVLQTTKAKLQWTDERCFAEDTISMHKEDHSKSILNDAFIESYEETTLEANDQKVAPIRPSDKAKSRLPSEDRKKTPIIKTPPHKNSIPCLPFSTQKPKPTAYFPQLTKQKPIEGPQSRIKDLLNNQVQPETRSSISKHRQIKKLMTNKELKNKKDILRQKRQRKQRTNSSQERNLPNNEQTPSQGKKDLKKQKKQKAIYCAGSKKNEIVDFFLNNGSYPTIRKFGITMGQIDSIKKRIINFLNR